MKLNGVGAIKDPRTNKVIWDFEDGPFETEDPELIAWATEGRGAKPEEPEPVKDAWGYDKAPGDKESLIEKASSLGMGAPSTLGRWSVKRLEREIEAQEAE